MLLSIKWTNYIILKIFNTWDKFNYCHDGTNGVVIVVFREELGHECQWEPSPPGGDTGPG